VPPDAGLEKRDTFSTIVIGLAGTGDRTRATCVAGSGNNSSAIYYDFSSLADIGGVGVEGKPNLPKVNCGARYLAIVLLQQ
jgi:hypothetical protein